MARHRPGRPTRRRRSSLRRLTARMTVALAAAAVTLTVASPGWAAAGDARSGAIRPSAEVPATPGPIKPGYSRLVDTSAVLQPAVTAGTGRNTVFVQLVGQGAAQVSAALLAEGQSATQVRLAVNRQRATIAARSAAVSAAAVAADAGAVTIFRVANAVPGLGVTADPAALRAVAALPSVVSVTAIVPKLPAAAPDSNQLAELAQTWSNSSLTGAGVRVGVIDTGIDYTSPDFGGTGSDAARVAADRSAPWTPTAKVLGGYDFVGDNYDAATQTSAGTPNPRYQSVPHPDSNPLDCNGHGTAVAGSIAGQGVDGSGHTFTGPYDQLTEPDLAGLKVAPGGAPQASLFALKVFGCAGATDAVIPALDWALDPNGDGDFSDHLDVVDLPLTGPPNVTDDPETAVLDSVAQLGVLPVVSGEPASEGTDAGTASGRASSVRSLVGGSATAAAAVLVDQARSSWTPEQVKAAVINTVDPTSAVSTRLLAYSSTTPGAVAVAFGVVPADVRQSTVVQTSAVVVQNTGAAPAELTLSYQAAVSQPGVSYQVSPGTLALPAGTSALATVTMTITPAELRHTLPPGAAAQQTNVLTGLDEARQYATGSSGALTISAPEAVDLQVPVSGSAKPVAVTNATDGDLSGSPAIVLAGTGVSLSSPSDPVSTSYTSLTSVLELGYRSAQLPACSGTSGASIPLVSDGPSATVSAAPPAGTPTRLQRTDCSAGAEAAGDLQAVGAGRTDSSATAAGLLWFGFSSYGDWATLGNGFFPTVNIDTNGDNTADYTVQVQQAGGNSDLLYALLFDDRGAGSLIDIYPVNFNLGNVDTNVFDTNVLLIPVDPVAIGYRPSMTSFPIRYSVATYSTYGAPQNSGTVDTTPAINFDVARPAITTAAPLWSDQGGAGITYRLAPGVTSADALVLHLHGAEGTRAQIVGLTGGRG